MDDVPAPGDVVLYAALSLDGYLAGPGDSLAFLDEVAGAADTYPEFIASIGALVMGRRTYDVVRSLAPWPYGELPTTVVTSRPMPDAPPGVTTDRGHDLPGLVRRLLRHGRVWLVGGGVLARTFLAAGLLDEVDLTVTPHVLGGGVPLWGPGTGAHRLQMASVGDVGAGALRVRYRVMPQ